MNFSNIYNFIFWCCYVSANVLSIIRDIGLLSNHHFWLTNITNERIITDNQVRATSSVLLIVDSSNIVRCKNNPSKLLEIQYRASKALYTALKCKYSHLIIDLLQFFFESVSACQSLRANTANEVTAGPADRFSSENEKCLREIVRTFDDVKKSVARMIYNVINLTKLSANLRSIDQSLIKSLVFMNACLLRREKPRGPAR